MNNFKLKLKQFFCQHDYAETMTIIDNPMEGKPLDGVASVMYTNGMFMAVYDNGVYVTPGTLHTVACTKCGNVKSARFVAKYREHEWVRRGETNNG